MRTQSLFAFLFATFAAAAPSPQVADQPIDFVVSIFEGSSTCDAGAKTVFGTGCVNKTLPAGGSALVRISTISPHGYVTGYAEENCTGEVLVVFTQTDGCTNFDDVTVKSWISAAPFDESGK